jgi:NTP pyrophosphatase (non-canonical NTP hydrolase)
MMMTEHEQVPGTEYYGNNHYDSSVDLIKELKDWEAEQLADMEEIDQYIFFDIYQDFTDSTAIYPPEKGLEYTALGLASEAGEFAGKVKKMIRDKTYDTDAMIAELGDVLWYVARAAAELDVHLSDVAKDNVEKLKSRMERNVVKGDGDNR